MTRAHDAEVAPIESGDGRDSATLGYGYDRCVHGSQRKVAVGADELSDPLEVGRIDRFQNELAAGEGEEQTDLRLQADPAAKKVRDLSETERGQQEGSRLPFQKLDAPPMGTIPGVENGNDRTRIDYERDSAASAAITSGRISSIRSAKSVRPLRKEPAAAASRGRRLPR